MKKEVIIAILVTFFALGVAIWVYINVSNNSSVPIEESGKPLAKKEQLLTKTSSEAEVTVDVTPVNILEDGETFDFNITLETHSVNLDQDLTLNSVLIDDENNSYNPIKWEGDPPGGHHRSGTLKFKSIIPKPKSLKLILKDIGGVKERVFEWDL